MVAAIADLNSDRMEVTEGKGNREYANYFNCQRPIYVSLMKRRLWCYTSLSFDHGQELTH